MFDRGLCTSHAPADAHAREVAPGQVDAVRQHRAVVQQAVTREPIDDAAPMRAPGPRVVVLRLGHVNVDAGPMVAREIAERGQARVAAA